MRAEPICCDILGFEKQQVLSKDAVSDRAVPYFNCNVEKQVLLSDALRGVADGETKFVKESQIQNILL